MSTEREILTSYLLKEILFHVNGHDLLGLCRSSGTNFFQKNMLSSRLSGYAPAPAPAPGPSPTRRPAVVFGVLCCVFAAPVAVGALIIISISSSRSEEHTSELQSLMLISY